MTNRDDNASFVTTKQQARFDNTTGAGSAYPIIVSGPRFGTSAVLNKQIESLKTQFHTPESFPETPLWLYPDHIATTTFDIGWEDIPPTPTWNPPDSIAEASFDIAWDGAPDFGAAESTFSETFVADNIDWDELVIPIEPFDFSAAESTFTDSFEVPPWA